MDGELSEEVYYDQLRMIEQLREFLKRINMMSMGKISGRIHKYDLFSNLSRIFPLKDETALNDLKYSLTKVMSNATLSILYVYPLLRDSYLVPFSHFLSRSNEVVWWITMNFWIQTLKDLFFPC